MEKIKKFFVSAIFLCLAFVSVIVAASCSGKDQPKVKEKEEVAKVSVESIKYDGESLTWNSVLHADNYEIKINGSAVTSAETKYSQVIKEDVTFEIRALVNETNEDYKSCSEYTSKAFTYKGQIAPTVEGRTYKWTAVEGCSGYMVIENGVVYQGYQQETEYDVVAETQEDGTLISTFQVKAAFEKETDFSVWSDKMTVQILTTPKNTVYNGKTISWDPVPGAESYLVTIKSVDDNGIASDYKTETVTNPAYVFNVMGDDDGDTDVEPIQIGTFTFTIVAKSSKNLVLDSDKGVYSMSFVEPVVNVYLNDGVITWDAIPNADYYIIKLDGQLLKDENNNPVKVYNNCYADFSKNCTVSVLPQREDGTLYSNWSATATMNFVQTPDLKWVYDGDNISYKLDWQTDAEGEAYPKDGKTFTIIVYDVYGDEINSLQLVSGKDQRTTTKEGTITYEKLNEFAKFTRGKKYAVRVLATSGDQELVTASSQLSNPVYFYFFNQPSAYTSISKDIYESDLTTEVTFNDVQIPSAFSGFNMDIQYRCWITDSNDFEVVGGETSHSANRTIKIVDSEDISEHKYTLGIQVQSEDDKKMLTDEEGHKVVFMIDPDPKTPAVKTYELTRLGVPSPKFKGSNITWDTVPKASGYVVQYIDSTGKKTEIPTTSLTYNFSDLPAGEYVVKVAARGNGNIMLTSRYSNAITFTKLATPQNLRVEELTNGTKVVKWDEVSGCSSYYYTLGTSSDTVYSAQSKALTKNQLSTAGLAFSVIAVGDTSVGAEKLTVSSNTSKSILLYKLPNPRNVVISNDMVTWDEVNALGNVTVGYNIYNGVGNKMNDTVLTEAKFNLYDYSSLKTSYEAYSLNILVETVLIDNTQKAEEDKTSLPYWPSELSQAYSVIRLASPSNIKMDQYTGVVSWDNYTGENPDYVAGYVVKLSYAKNSQANESYYVTTNSFEPDFQYFTDDTVEITVRAVGNQVNTISSNPYNVTVEGEANKIGIVAKLEKLEAPTMAGLVSYTVDATNHITVVIDGTNSIKGNGYGISIGGVNNVIRTYVAEEGLYEKVDGVLQYTLKNGSIAQYYPATAETPAQYKYISRYSTAGTYNIKVRVQGGNYSQDTKLVSAETICYVTSDYSSDAGQVVILGQLGQNEIKLSSDQKSISFGSVKNAKKYEVTIKYTKAGGTQVGEELHYEVEATTASTLSQAITVPEGANSIVVTIRAIGDGETIFSSLQETTTEIVIANTK